MGGCEDGGGAGVWPSVDVGQSSGSTQQGAPWPREPGQHCRKEWEWAPSPPGANTEAGREPLAANMAAVLGAG